MQMTLHPTQQLNYRAGAILSACLLKAEAFRWWPDRCINTCPVPLPHAV